MNHLSNSAHWHILGAGAIGSLWLAQLSRSDIPCTLLVRPERLPEGQHSQITELHITEEGRTHRLVTSLESTSASSTITHLLVTTKAGDVLPALKALQQRLMPNTIFVLLQNGMGSQQQVVEHFPENPVYAGSTTDGAWRERALHIHRAGRGETWLGALNVQAKAARTPLPVIKGMNIQFTDNILPRLQEKLAINSAINGLTALHNCAMVNYWTNDFSQLFRNYARRLNRY